MPPSRRLRSGRMKNRVAGFLRPDRFQASPETVLGLLRTRAADHPATGEAGVAPDFLLPLGALPQRRPTRDRPE